ncbi:hypothetical protein STAIW_v1c04490 [Spiroplasma taiwanense CT-1]|uniref:Uncharacterized protein n=1 Tax=Spiroplasma taiwanense CT-1 TaxID=1276220 RepID=S5MGX1_9MOLU|nr:hypothetical protein STAIW_v1c04490 [Spiroplasma taiwanense CT-1]
MMILFYERTNYEKTLVKICTKCLLKIKENQRINSFKNIDIFGNDIYEYVHESCTSIID